MNHIHPTELLLLFLSLAAFTTVLVLSVVVFKIWKQDKQVMKSYPKEVERKLSLEYDILVTI